MVVGSLRARDRIAIRIRSRIETSIQADSGSSDLQSVVIDLRAYRARALAPRAFTASRLSSWRRPGGGTLALLLAAVGEDPRPHVELQERPQHHQQAAGVDDRPAGVGGDLEDRLELARGLARCAGRVRGCSSTGRRCIRVVQRVVHPDRVRLVLDARRLVGQPDLALELVACSVPGLEADVEVVELELEAQRLAVDVVDDLRRRASRNVTDPRRGAGRGSPSGCSQISLVWPPTVISARQAAMPLPIWPLGSTIGS